MTKLLVKLFIKDSENVKNAKVRSNYGVFSGIVGIILNAILFVGKFFAGVISGSISITADAFNNLSDAGSSILTLVGFKMAGKPADDEHPFGHGRIEYITGFIISIVIILMGIEIGKDAVAKIFNPQEVVFSYIALAIMLGSIIVKVWLGLFNRKLGNIINSKTMKAAAMDSLSDVISTTAVIIGFLVAKIFEFNIDGYLGAVVAFFIILAGISTAKGMLGQLLGEAPDKEFINGITEFVLSNDSIIGVHDIVVHSYGANICIVSLHAEIPGDMSVFEIHEIVDKVERELNEKFNCQSVIHMDPLATDEETKELLKKFKQIVKSIDERLSIHDFRAVNAVTFTNIIFDVVVPFNLKIQNEELKNIISQKSQELDETYNTIIHIDRG